MVNINRRYDLTKKVINKFDKQNNINPPVLVMKLSETPEEKEFLTKLIKLIFFSEGDDKLS